MLKYDNPRRQNLDNNDEAASAVSFLTNHSANVIDVARRGMQLKMGLPSAMIDGKHVKIFGGHDGSSSRHYRNGLPDSPDRATSNNSSSGGEAYRTSSFNSNRINKATEEDFAFACSLLGTGDEEGEGIAGALLRDFQHQRSSHATDLTAE